jgi:hypothetical protein
VPPFGRQVAEQRLRAADRHVVIKHQHIHWPLLVQAGQGTRHVLGQPHAVDALGIECLVQNNLVERTGLVDKNLKLMHGHFLDEALWRFDAALSRHFDNAKQENSEKP